MHTQLHFISLSMTTAQPSPLSRCREPQLVDDERPAASRPLFSTILISLPAHAPASPTCRQDLS